MVTKHSIMASLILFLLVIAFTQTSARSVLEHSIKNSTRFLQLLQNSHNQTATNSTNGFASPPNSPHVLSKEDNDNIMSFARTKRSVDACPVHPDTPVILNGKETYFEFDENEASPAPHPGDSEKRTCPSQYGSWWPGVSNNLRASCPWSWTTFDTWSIVPHVYPRYVTQARCLCQKCVNAQGMRCKALERKFQFYRKTSCQGNKPVFFAAKMKITVGCYCAL